MNEIKTFDERKKTLIKIGKEKGYITFEELADNLKGLEMDSDSLDELYNLFHDMGIEVVSDDVDDTSDESGSGVGLDDLSIPKTISINDPVRMYLKEIGKISLLSLDEELELSKRVAEGDVEAKNKLAESNLRLVVSIAKRYVGRNLAFLDLIQEGNMGLMKAVDKFDLSYDVKFSTYAVPMIAGEIKRFLRDDGMLKVSRSIKENQYRIYKMREKLEKNLGREPTVTELAEELGMTPEEIAMASDAATEVESIYRPIHQGEGTELQLLDKLPEKENRQERILDKIFLEELLNILGTEERRLICMRYFCDMTQTEVAKRLGISQVQVSRMEKRILHRLKKEIQDKTEV